MAYTVTEVQPNPKPWRSSRGDDMLGYRLTLQNGTETVTNCELSQKASTPAPTVGQELDGTIDREAQYGPKFKKAYAGGPGGGGRPRDPKETAAIQRQHSQKVAAMIVQAKATAGVATPEDFTPAKLKQLTDYFEADIQRHPLAGSSG